MEHQMHPAVSLYERNRLLIKGLLIGLLVLLMLIPAALIRNLVRERAARQDEVAREISSKWAGSQTVTGPVLLVPYQYATAGPDGKTITQKKLAHFLPDELKITGSVAPEVRGRSLYQVTVYRSGLTLTGRFQPLPLEKVQIDPGNMLWHEARLLLGISDNRGLEDEVSLSWNGNRQTFDAGLPENRAVQEGLSIPVAIDAGTIAAFSISLKLRGSSNLFFTPVGRTTEVSLQSPWQHPAYDGKYLPDTGTTLSGKGFNAHWKVLQASRPFPQYWKDGSPDLQGQAFGVRLIRPADGYAKTERSVKYAILFIALTFAIFFFLEILQKRQVHPLQYLLVGFALIIFYSLLLSISEYTGFNTAYGIATAATVSLIGFYVSSVFRSIKTGLGFALALSGLYGYIFILIQLEDYSLLFGSIGLFVILALLMYASRKIDWYGTEKGRLATVVD